MLNQISLTQYYHGRQWATKVVIILLPLFRVMAIITKIADIRVKMHMSELEISGGIEDNSKIIFLIYQQKHML